MFTRFQRGPMLRTAPTGEPVGDPGTGAPAAPPVPTATATAQPAVFDPATLAPEAKSYLDSQIARAKADADAKARTQSKENARKELFEEFARAAGVAPEATDPVKLAEQLGAQQAENRRLRVDAAVTAACRAQDVGADESLMLPVLVYSGKLADLDPAAPDFGDKVKALVLAEVTANPRLKNATTPVQPAANGSFGTPTAPRSANLHGALSSHYKA